MKIFLPFVLSAVVFVCGCNNLFTKGEPAAELDPNPPSGYAPVYVHALASLPARPKEKPAFYLSRIESSEPNRIRLFVHLVDSNGNYLYGGAKQKIWCSLTDYVNGKPTEIKDFKVREVSENDHVPTAIALVMDHSGSMGEERARKVQDAAEQFIDMKKPEDAIALIKYDNKVVVESGLYKDGFIVKTKLQKNGLTGFGGLTAIGDGIAAGVAEVASAKQFDRRAVMVFTDGQDNSSSVLKDSVITLARKTNTLICCVDFGVNTDKQYLQDIANNCGGTYHNVYSSREFEPVFGDIYRKLKNYYVIDYSPRAYGLHTVSLKVCLPGQTVVAERSFDNMPIIGSSGLVDVNFDLDKADITSSSQPAIDNIVYLMKAFPAMTIELRGHTDNLNNTKDPDYNKKLSGRRADAVKGAIAKAGINVTRITAVGFGESVPIADNSSEDGRARNRRTEIAIMSR